MFKVKPFKKAKNTLFLRSKIPKSDFSEHINNGKLKYLPQICLIDTY